MAWIWFWLKRLLHVGISPQLLWEETARLKPEQNRREARE
jgi:hypothetical protein